MPAATVRIASSTLRGVAGHLALACALAVAACAPADQTPPADTTPGPDRAVVSALVEDFDAGLNGEDVDALMTGFAQNPVSMPPGEPAVTGREAVRTFWSELMAQGDVTVDNVLVDFHADGDLLVARGTYTLSIAPAEGEPIEDAGWWVAWFQRDADGTWKCLGNAWSSDNPPPGASS